MPIEIREIIIRAVVNQQGGGGASTGASPNSTSSPDVIQETVEQVMQIIKDKNER